MTSFEKPKFLNPNRFQAMTPSPPAANTLIIGLDADGKVCCCNGAVERITGFSTSELLGGKWFERLVPHQNYPHPDKSKDEGSACGHLDDAFELPLVTKFGAARQILWHLHDPAPIGQAFARLLIGIDVTERKKIELLIRKLEGRWEQLANSVLITDKNGIIEYVNPKFSQTTGYKDQDVIGKTPRILKSGRIPSKVYEDLWQTLLSGEVWQGEFYNRKKNGEIYWCLETISPIRDSRGDITHFVSVTNNINENGSDGLAARNLALYDPLTNLPGRRLLRDRLQQSVAGVHRYGGILCLLHLNLNRFKQVNDTLGHEAGDRLLLHVANRLTPALRESDTLARLGGDEFAIVAPRLAHNEDAVILAQRLLDTFRQAFELDGRELFVTASIGISLAPGDSDNSDILLKNADIALQCAKDAGCNNFCFFSPEMNVSTTERLDLETDLRHALERDQFVLHYQPQIDTASGLVVGVEALIRWNHPVRGLVAPMLFIPLAEATRLILPISEWTLKTACRQMRAWHDAGLSGLRVAVNLSALYFQQPDLVMTIETVLRETQLEPVFLELEITESLLMQQTEMTISTLKALRKIGVLLSIDDFGTGFSSLNYIKRMPVNTLKIDRAFVCDVTTNPEDAALAKAIISMAHSLHLRVVAEGVETAGQSAFFVEHHCDEIQGYFYSKPLAAAQCADFLRLNQQQDVAGRIAEARGLLLVDDEVNIINSLKRVLRKDGYRILTAESGAGRPGIAIHASGRGDHFRPAHAGDDRRRIPAPG